MVNRSDEDATIRRFAGDRPRLAIEEVGREEIVLGRFQRAASAVKADPTRRPTRRTSGGPALLAGPGTVHVALALPNPAALADADAARLVNRYVRPLLKALAKVGALSHYFGRDFVTAKGKAVAWVGFAHEAASGTSLFEALVAVSHPFALPRDLDAYPARREAPYMGKKAGTIAEVAGKEVDPARVRGAIEDAYEAAYGPIARADGIVLRVDADDRRAGWTAVTEEAIGFVGAIAEPGDASIGGDFLASEDLVAALETGLARADDASLDEAIDAAFAATNGALEGVRDRASLLRVIREARSRSARISPR